jgi:hypothetical protein
MKILHHIREDEVIATFLRAEVGSGRYGEKLRGLLTRDPRDEAVARHPDLADADELSSDELDG